MKVIGTFGGKLKKIVQRIVWYQCEVCKTRHPSKKEALRCEKKPVEEKIFSLGDTVQLNRFVYCHNLQHPSQKFRAVGRIVRVRKPEPADEDYENRYLGGKRERKQSHVLSFEIKYKCPFCKKEKDALCLTPEMELVKKNKKNR
ncbi:MAG: hypothetical protein AAB495_02010 [Patescibacteria group bacterium]